MQVGFEEGELWNRISALFLISLFEMFTNKHLPFSIKKRKRNTPHGDSVDQGSENHSHEPSRVHADRASPGRKGLRTFRRSHSVALRTCTAALALLLARIFTTGRKYLLSGL